ncbi:MAG: DNA gyrase/topoisomerase IV subunit A [Chitinophagales bacterium]|nr:DNA gyrase/topoisomerase IV subunit A [Chitinophagales bacterium]
MKPEQKATITHIDALFEKWFLEYASYVNLDRAIPNIKDGLKPVQRRILHAMKQQDDGRYTKVANIIGQTMQYHPHGDQSIADALVNIGQKNVLIDTQGNWGDIRTGDSAAAPRYIEARLTGFALETCFHEQNTDWQLSYDGRKKEPTELPIKFPLLLCQGAEGIGVGLSTNILPHNFVELCQASIKIIQQKEFQIFPDFPTGGLIDIENYQNGVQGGKVKVRAIIEKLDSKTLVIKSVPFSVTTPKLIESILKANEIGKLKIKKVIDNTAEEVEILIELPPNVSPDVTIDSLYAFTRCEISLSPLGCCILDNKPIFIGVDEMLRISTENTVKLLNNELNFKLNDLSNQLHVTTLEKIFFEKQIYKHLESRDLNWDEVIEKIKQAFIPYLGEFTEEITHEQYVKLTEKPVSRIHKVNLDLIEDKILKLRDEIAQIQHHIAHIDQYAVDYFQDLIKKYGKLYPRKSEIQTFYQIEAKQVIISNQKLYVNRKDGFIGYGMKKEEFVADCSDLDDVLIIRKDTTMLVTKIGDKKFVGQDIEYVGIWKKDEKTTYNLIYSDIESNRNFVKRFQVTAITRDKEYLLGKSKTSRLLYLSINPNQETEVVQVKLTESCKARIKIFDFDFESVIVKGRSSIGNIISNYPIRLITLKKEGVAQIDNIDYFYHPDSGLVDDKSDESAQYLGKFKPEDSVLVIFQNGTSQIYNPSAHFRINANDAALVLKFNKNQVFTMIYFDGESKNKFVKRFLIEQFQENKSYPLYTPHAASKMLFITPDPEPIVEVQEIKGGFFQALQGKVSR